MFKSSKTTWRTGAGFVCTWAVSFGIAVAAIAVSSQAQETGRGEPAPFEIQVFSEPEFSGAVRNIVLAPGSSYAYFERLDDEEISAVRSLKAGAAVGVVLFRHAYFVSRDQSCAATLGSDEKPDLIWTGATADFLPATPGTSAIDEMSDAGAKGYASAILFRRADGPPPGALLMKRRRSYGKGCGNILRSLNFDRRFVPMDFQTSLSEGGERAAVGQSCVNLQGAKVPGKAGAASVRLSDMRKSDRIALLQPSDLDQSYRARDRRFHAVLFDGNNCQGESVRIDTPFAPKPNDASIRRDLLLSNFLFRDRVRSIRVVASDGRAQRVSEATIPAPATGIKSGEAAKLAPIQKPESGKNLQRAGTPTAEPGVPALASKAGAEAAKSVDRESVLNEPKASPLDVKAALAAANENPAQAGLSTAKLEPMTELPVQPKATETSANAVVTTVAVAPSVKSLQATQMSKPVAHDTVGLSTPTARFTEETTPVAEKGPLLVQKPGGGVPKGQTAQAGTEQGEPSTPAGSEPATPGQQVFTFPVYDVYRLNYCLNAKGGCGEPAASKWCELKGFKRAIAWQKDDNIGGIFPTFLIGERRICAQYKCDGFAEVTCGN